MSKLANEIFEKMKQTTDFSVRKVISKVYTNYKIPFS